MPAPIEPRTEEVWSYLIGVVPVGKEFRLDQRMYDDLKMRRSTVSSHVSRLVRAGKVRRVGPSTVIVLDRDIPYREKYKRQYDSGQEEDIDWSGEIIHPRVTVDGHKIRRDAMRLMAQIPDDTRDLTGRIFGDPLPGRSALDMKMMECQLGG